MIRFFLHSRCCERGVGSTLMLSTMCSTIAVSTQTCSAHPNLQLVGLRAAYATMPVLWPCTFANYSQAVWLYFLPLCEFEMAVSRLCCLVGLVVVLGASGCVTLSRPVGFEGPFVQNRVLGLVFSQGSSFSIRCSCAQMESPWSKMYLCQGAAAR